MATSEHPPVGPTDQAGTKRLLRQKPARRVVDAPVCAFHWLFALSFAGAWLTAESERWHGLHVALGYAFGGLLVFRLAYGLVGPRHARLASLWCRASGIGDWLRQARSGLADLPRAATLGVGLAVLLLLAVAGPVVLCGYAIDVDAWGMEHAWGEFHEFLANTAMALVVAHLALIAVLSVARHRNLARPMLTGHVPGPDLVKSNRAWLAALLLVIYLGFMAWQTAGSDVSLSSTSHRERHGRHHDDD